LWQSGLMRKLQPIPDLGEVKEIRMPAEYRDNPEMIKAYLTGFKNAWLLAQSMQDAGPKDYPPVNVGP